MRETPKVENEQVWYRKDGDDTIYIKILTVVQGGVRYTTFAKWAWPDRKRYPVDSTMKIDSLVSGYKLATPLQIAHVLKGQPIEGTEECPVPEYDAARHVAAELRAINKKVNEVRQGQNTDRTDFRNTMTLMHNRMNELNNKFDRILEALGEPTEV